MVPRNAGGRFIYDCSLIMKRPVEEVHWGGGDSMIFRPLSRALTYQSYGMATLSSLCMRTEIEAHSRCLLSPDPHHLGNHFWSWMPGTRSREQIVLPHSRSTNHQLFYFLFLFYFYALFLFYFCKINFTKIKFILKYTTQD